MIMANLNTIMNNVSSSDADANSNISNPGSSDGNRDSSSDDCTGIFNCLLHLPARAKSG